MRPINVLLFFIVFSAAARAQTPQSADSLMKLKEQEIFRNQELAKEQEVLRQKNEETRKSQNNDQRQPAADQKPQNSPSTASSLPAAVASLPSGNRFLMDSLDVYIERGMKQWQIPGLAIAIVKDGKVILSKGYGVREWGKEDKVDENTLFIIASNSKLFTGTALAKLDHEKKLSLNDKVTQHISWFKLYDSNSTRLATVRDMLCHRIGLKTFQGDFTFWDSNLPKDSIIWKMRYLKPSLQFRQDYGYCNAGFLVAGQVLEKITGQTWETYVQQHILTPLGMTNTYMNTSGLAGRNNIAAPHNNLFSPLTKIPFDQVDNLGPATSMVSNVKDLSRWLLLQLDSGRYAGSRILPWEVIQKTRDVNILTGSRRSAVYPTHFRGYGLGVFATDYSGRQVYWHTGGAFGHVTNVCFVPEENLGITILSNNDNQNFFEALRYQLLDAYLNVAYTDRSKFQWGFYSQGKRDMDGQLAALKTRVDKKTLPAIVLEDFTGDYFNTVYGKISISKSGARLICRFQHHPELLGYMDYMDNNEFRVTYSNIGYGIYPAKFSLNAGKPVAVEIKANDFVESDAYLFVKDPAGLMIK